MGASNPQKKPSNPPVVDIENVAAATECTGLIPAAIPSEDAARNYAELFGIHKQKPTNWKS